MARCESKLKIKRVYEKPEKNDGTRILVDRLWPRGLKKEGARIDFWMKDIAPSHELRKWFGHRGERWQEFKKRYIKELEDKGHLIKKLEELGKGGCITLLYAAKDDRNNNAQVLLELIDKR